MPDDRIHANGVSGLTGEYLLPSLDAAAVARRAREAPDDPTLAAELRRLRDAIDEPSFALPFNVHPERVAEAGWAVVFSREEGEAVRAALAPLIEHRGRSVGDDVVKVLDYERGEGWPEWLARHGVAQGNLDPRKVPYYVVLVGPPKRIPFAFQYLLSTEYAVGRLDFDDAEGYGGYVAALIDHEESNGAGRDRAATFFGSRHRLDASTQLSADSLLAPLADAFRPGGRFADAVPGWRIDEMVGEPATKEALGELLGGEGARGRPALVFAATHGIGGWPAGHPDQQARHGALLCQEWPGVGRIGAQHYFAADDLASDARVHGLVAFFFACYSAGTPHADDFAEASDGPPPTIAAEPFTARLPKALLSHRRGGALAVIGHIERAWGYSFVSGGQPQLVPFQNAIGRILRGEPIGHAVKDFGQRFAVLSATISELLRSISFGGRLVPDAELARLWTERSDARNYVVLGDPAAALPAP